MRDQNYAYGGGLVTERGLRRMTRWGFAVLAVWAVALVIWGVLWPEPHARGWLLVLDLFLFGRTVCAYEGVRLGFGGIYLFIQGGTQDIGFFLLVFPWFIRFYEHVVNARYIGWIFRAITRAAERNREFLQGYGPTGLFLFVFFPVSGTGTLIGSVVGYLLGMPMRLVMPIVIAGHLTSIAFLIVFFTWLEPALRSVNEGFAQYFAWILLAAMLFLGWLYSVVKRFWARGRGNLPVRPLNECEANADGGE